LWFQVGRGNLFNRADRREKGKRKDRNRNCPIYEEGGNQCFLLIAKEGKKESEESFSEAAITTEGTADDSLPLSADECTPFGPSREGEVHADHSSFHNGEIKEGETRNHDGGGKNSCRRLFYYSLERGREETRGGEFRGEQR